MPFGRKAQIYSSNKTVGGPSPQQFRRNYGSEQTGIRRHAFTTAPDIASVGSPGTLPPGEYFGWTLAAMQRAFGGTSDSEPTATASNNYQTPRVMNGSKIQNMNSKITIKNNSTNGTAILDVYLIALSYYDALIWSNIRPANAVCLFDAVTIGPPDRRGEVNPNAVGPLVITYNDVANFKFQQHYLRKLGTVTIGNQDQDSVVEMLIQNIPSKCRRSQTGMFYGIVFHNDTTKNGSSSQLLTATLDHKFEEIPSANRLPYIE